VTPTLPQLVRIRAGYWRLADSSLGLLKLNPGDWVAAVVTHAQAKQACRQWMADQGLVGARYRSLREAREVLGACHASRPWPKVRPARLRACGPGQYEHPESGITVTAIDEGPRRWHLRGSDRRTLSQTKTLGAARLFINDHFLTPEPADSI
jgi:hypothetical protein